MRDYAELLEKLMNSSPESQQLDNSSSAEQFEPLPVDDNGYTENVLMEGIPGMSDVGALTRENLNPIPLRNDTPLDMRKLMSPKASQIESIPPSRVPAASGLPSIQKAVEQSMPSATAEVSSAPPSAPQASSIDELKAAQEQRNSELNNLAIFRGLVNSGQSMGYQKQDPNIGKSFETISNNKVADVMQRKEAQAKDIDFKKAALQLKNSEAEGDPKSEVSKALREAIKLRYKSIGHPININDNLSAAQLKTMYPSGDLADDFLKMDTLRANKLSMLEAKKEAKEDKLAKEMRLTDKQISSVNEFDKTIEQAKSALSLLGNKSEWTGPVDAKIPDLLVGPEQVAWRSAIGRMSDAYRQLITGAGASNLELAKLESRLPQPSDSLANFQAKAKELIKETEKAKSGYLSNLSKAGKNVKEFKNPTLPDQESSSTTATSPGASSQKGSKQAKSETVNNDAKIESFMKKNGISDKNEAIRILKENGKI